MADPAEARINPVDALAQIVSVDDVIRELKYRHRFSRLAVRELALEAGLDHGTVSRILSGRRRTFTLDTAIRLAYALVSDEKRRLAGPDAGRNLQRRRAAGA